MKADASIKNYLSNQNFLQHYQKLHPSNSSTLSSKSAAKPVAGKVTRSELYFANVDPAQERLPSF
jgi:hypothetical protein